MTWLRIGLLFLLFVLFVVALCVASARGDEKTRRAIKEPWRDV